MGEWVPAWELPYWRAHFADEPTGFRAWDMLASKTAMYVCGAVGKLKPGASAADFMFKNRFENLDLTDDEFRQLSPEEQELYLQRQVTMAKQVLN